jgi:hypothetical protein
VWPPVVLTPTAGITNPAFRKLCREQGAGLYVCEMVTTVALVERNPKTLKMIAFGDDERPRSLQLYGVDPDIMAKAFTNSDRTRFSRSYRPELRLPEVNELQTYRYGRCIEGRRAAAKVTATTLEPERRRRVKIRSERNDGAAAGQAAV